jgi:hypothetical protein
MKHKIRQARVKLARALYHSISAEVGGGKAPYLLTPQKGSTKLAHNADVTDEWEQVILYMLPHRLGRSAWEQNAARPALFGAINWPNVCPHSSAGCRAVCLHAAGRLGMAEIAKLARTALYAIDPDAFWLLIDDEIRRHRARLAAQGKRLAVRINGTSDIDIPEALLDAHRDVVFTDYTKRPDIALSWNAHHPNRYVVFSATERTPDAQIATLLAAGHNVVVPFQLKRGEDLPQSYLGHTVIDGDKHDLRFLDSVVEPDAHAEGGVIVGLRYKIVPHSPEHHGFIRPVPVTIG